MDREEARKEVEMDEHLVDIGVLYERYDSEPSRGGPSLP